MQAIREGHEAVKAQCVAIAEWAAAVGKKKRTDFAPPSRELDSRIEVRPSHEYMAHICVHDVPDWDVHVEDLRRETDKAHVLTGYGGSGETCCQHA